MNNDFDGENQCLHIKNVENEANMQNRINKQKYLEEYILYIYMCVCVNKKKLKTYRKVF